MLSVPTVVKVYIFSLIALLRLHWKIFRWNLQNLLLMQSCFKWDGLLSSHLNTLTCYNYSFLKQVDSRSKMTQVFFVSFLLYVPLSSSYMLIMFPFKEFLIFKSLLLLCSLGKWPYAHFFRECIWKKINFCDIPFSVIVSIVCCLLFKQLFLIRIVYPSIYKIDNRKFWFILRSFYFL